MVSERSRGDKEQARECSGGGRLDHGLIMYMYDKVITKLKYLDIHENVMCEGVIY